MASGPAVNAAHHRDLAVQFRALADLEPSDTLRQQLQRLAKRHDGLAADLEANKTDEKSTFEPAHFNAGSLAQKAPR